MLDSWCSAQIACRPKDDEGDCFLILSLNSSYSACSDVERCLIRTQDPRLEPYWKLSIKLRKFNMILLSLLIFNAFSDKGLFNFLKEKLAVSSSTRRLVNIENLSNNI